MDKNTKELALKILKIKDELVSITFNLSNNDYVTFSDERRLLTSIVSLEHLDFLEDFLSEDC